MFQFLQHNQIDLQAWDQMNANSKHGSAFLWSDHLNTFCKWDAIIFGDYEGGLAIASKRKMGLSMAYQPAFTQCNKWIGEIPDNESLNIISDLLKAKYGDIRINSNLALPGFKVAKRTNLILPMLVAEEDLHFGFSKDLKKNLRKIQDQHLVIEEVGDPTQCIALYQAAYGELNKQLLEVDYQNFNAYIQQLIPKDRALVLHIRKGEGGGILAALVFLKSHSRLHYVLGAPTEEGRKLNALSMAFWEIIQRFSGKQWILDFEGSSIQSVARFYKSFGSVEEPFYELSASPNPLVKIFRSRQSQ